MHKSRNDMKPKGAKRCAACATFRKISNDEVCALYGKDQRSIRKVGIDGAQLCTLNIARCEAESLICSRFC